MSGSGSSSALFFEEFKVGKGKPKMMRKHRTQVQEQQREQSQGRQQVLWFQEVQPP